MNARCAAFFSFFPHSDVSSYKKSIIAKITIEKYNLVWWLTVFSSKIFLPQKSKNTSEKDYITVNNIVILVLRSRKSHGVLFHILQPTLTRMRSIIFHIPLPAVTWLRSVIFYIPQPTSHLNWIPVVILRNMSLLQAQLEENSKPVK